MTPRIISAIAFKLAAIYVLVSALLAAPVFFYSVQHMEEWGIAASPVWPSIITAGAVVVGIAAFSLLWVAANRVIAQVPADSEQIVDIESLELAALQILGVYLAIAAFAELPKALDSIWRATHAPEGVSSYEITWLLSAVMQLVLGLLLVAKARTWRSVLRRLR